MLISETEKLGNIEKMETLGLLLPWEKFMLVDPNLTEKQAMEKWQKIQDLKMKQINLLNPEESVQEVEDEEEEDVSETEVEQPEEDENEED